MQLNISQTIDHSPISAFQYRVVFLCALVALLDGFDIQVMALVIPSVSGEWNIPPHEFGPVLSASFVGIMLGAMTGGICGDRFGRRYVLIAAFVLVGLMSVLTSTAETTTQLMVFRLMTGFGIGACMPNFTALAAEYVPGHRMAFFVTVVFSAVPLGGVLGGFFAGNLIELLGWRAIFVFGGAVPLAITLLLLFSLPESIRFLVSRGTSNMKVGKFLERIVPTYRHASENTFIMDKGGSASSLRALFAAGMTGTTIVLWFVFFFSLAGMYLLTSWLPTVLSQHGLPMHEAIQSISYFWLGGIVGGWVAGWLSDRFGGFIVVAVAFFADACLTAAVGIVDVSVSQLMIVVVLAGFAVAGAQSGLTALTAKLYPTTARSTAVGWGLGVGRLGAVISPLLGGMAMAAQWSKSSLFTVGAVPALICAIAILVLWMSRRSSDSAMA